MAKLNFDIDKIMGEAVKKGIAEMKAKHKRDILKISSRYGETPNITFKTTGKNTFEANFSVESDELRREIEEYLKKQS